MKLLICSVNKVMLMAVVVILMAGCMRTVWPQRSVIVALPAASATFEDVQKFADQYLLAQHFTPMGKAGYDAIKGTRTVFDYQGPGGLIATIGPSGTHDITKCRAVAISFSQDSKVFTPEANRAFEVFVKTLREKWPGAVEEAVDRQRAISPRT